MDKLTELALILQSIKMTRELVEQNPNDMECMADLLSLYACIGTDIDSYISAINIQIYKTDKIKFIA